PVEFGSFEGPAMIDLVKLKLVPDHHNGQNTTNTCSPMVAVARLAGETDNEHPLTCCPVLASFVRAISRRASPVTLELMKMALPCLVGTRASEEAEQMRAYGLAD